MEHNTKILQQEHLFSLERSKKSDMVNFSLLMLIVWLGMATTAMQDFEGQIPAIFALSSFIWLIFVTYTLWKIQKRHQKDIEKGTYYTIDGKVSALYFNVLTLDGKKIRISYNLRRGISVGDRVRLYLTTASKTIFKIEKILQTPPDVL
jgi:hypothetical protein